jgi:hypothetical protein
MERLVREPGGWFSPSGPGQRKLICLSRENYRILLDSASPFWKAGVHLRGGALRASLTSVHGTPNSIAVARTPGSPHDCEDFERCGNDAGVKASTPTDVRFVAVNWSNDFPRPRQVGEYYKVILLDSRTMKVLRRQMRGRQLPRRRPPVGRGRRW